MSKVKVTLCKMPVLETLLDLDQQLFSYLYSLPNPEILDWIMSFFSLIGEAALIWVIPAGYFYLREKNTKRLLLIIVSVIALMVINEFGFKPLFGRVRPLATFNRMKFYIRILPTLTKSFPSTHAAASFALAYILSYFNKDHKIVLYSLAVLISYSRIYLGYHYPLDVIAGVLYGIFFAKTVIVLARKVRLL